MERGAEHGGDLDGPPARRGVWAGSRQAGRAAVSWTCPPLHGSASAVLHVSNILCLHLSDAKALLKDKRKTPHLRGFAKDFE